MMSRTTWDRIFRERDGRSPIEDFGNYSVARISMASVNPVANEVLIQTGVLAPLWMNRAIHELQAILTEVRAIRGS